METIQIPQKAKDEMMDLVDRTDEDEVHIVLTDVTFHSTEACNPMSFARGVQKTITNGLPGRAYYNNSIRRLGSDGVQVHLPIFAGLQEVVEKAWAKGKRVRFFLPKDGIPMFLGKDAHEKIAALKRKGEL
jgi:hypothetical protein